MKYVDDTKKIISILSKIFQYLEEHPEILEEIFKDKKVQEKKELKKPTIDIYAIYQESGREGLKKVLENMSIEELKNIIRHYRLDPTHKTLRWKKRDKLISFILNTVESKLSKGMVFIKDDEINKKQ